jgi:hypothetical protein
MNKHTHTSHKARGKPMTNHGVSVQQIKSVACQPQQPKQSTSYTLSILHFSLPRLTKPLLHHVPSQQHQNLVTNSLPTNVEFHIHQRPTLGASSQPTLTQCICICVLCPLPHGQLQDSRHQRRRKTPYTIKSLLIDALRSASPAWHE